MTLTFEMLIPKYRDVSRIWQKRSEFCNEKQGQFMRIYVHKVL